MAEWDGWDLARAVVLFSGVFYVGMLRAADVDALVGRVQAQGDVGPVAATPMIAAAAVAGTVSRGGAVGCAVAGVLGIAILLGLVVMALHLRGVLSQIGRLSLRNHRVELTDELDDHGVGRPKVTFNFGDNQHVTPGGAQPGQTIMALATRLADHLLTGAAGRLATAGTET